MTVHELSPKRLFYITLWTSLGVKLLLAATIPITGDEAYFIFWGRHPGLGYYDHPPMVGLWLSALLSVSEAIWWLRLPAVFLSTLIGIGIVYLIKERDENLAWLTGALFLIIPVNALNVLITTDTPVILFSFLTVMAFDLAVRRERMRWYFFAGFFLGMALLSKYFAGLLAVALAAYLPVAEKPRQVFRGLLLVVLISSILFGINVYWNYNHCLDNFQFNFINRNRGSVPWYSPLIYLATLAYLLTPPVAWNLLKRNRSRPLHQPQTRLLLVLNLVPYGLLLLLSFGKIIGMHWLLGFCAFSIMLVAMVWGEPTLRQAWRFNLWFTLGHLVLLLIAIFTPWHQLPLSGKLQKEIIDATRGEWIWQELKPYAENRLVFTHSYAASSELAYHAGRPVGVYSYGSSHAREDDKHTRFDQLDGENFVIFLNKYHGPENYTPYFDSIDYQTLSVRGSQFDIVIGTGFRYPEYREGILKNINRNFYQIPDGWPVGACYFKERYGFE
ncbi:MAG: glycosyltransferase family 39 protein [Gammaproteobacteria bacterium]|nr:glycosyltransferase family 39 protein [Gammaproteobacteria bacterium]